MRKNILELKVFFLLFDTVLVKNNPFLVFKIISLINHYLKFSRLDKFSILNDDLCADVCETSHTLYAQLKPIVILNVQAQVEYFSWYGLKKNFLA